eukprot:3186222-Rhodomonas_salina.1
MSRGLTSRDLLSVLTSRDAASCQAWSGVRLTAQSWVAATLAVTGTGFLCLVRLRLARLPPAKSTAFNCFLPCKVNCFLLCKVNRLTALQSQLLCKSCSSDCPAKSTAVQCS